MNYTISNDFLTIAASDTGAELQSLKYNGVEYLWQGNPEYWSYRAPILFPIVGKLKGGAMLYDGNKYIMKNHGICRDAAFSLTEQSACSLTFTLKSNEEIVKAYPFDFTLNVTYTITASTLETKLDVNNESSSDMFFSIGGHPAFNCPLLTDEEFKDYEIILNKNETAGTRLLDPDGLVTNKTMTFFNQSRTIPLDYEHYHKLGTLVFKNLNSTQAILRSKKSEFGIIMDFTGFEYFAVWTKRAAPFICLEPWQGICDSSFYSGNFRGKTGTIHLPPAENYTRKFTITPISP